MTTEERDLLMKDLCGRLPYRVRCRCTDGLGGGETERGVLKYAGNCYGVISNYYEDVPLHSGFVNNVFYPIENIRPYLRPLESMTKEERAELGQAILKDRISPYGEIRDEGADNLLLCTVRQSTQFQDWLNSKHFDHRGLIGMGLAIEAPEGMYVI